VDALTPVLGVDNDDGRFTTTKLERDIAGTILI
jgi:hypothetical protein